MHNTLTLQNMNVADVRTLLQRACNEQGSNRAWARLHKVSAAYVGDVLLCRREPGPAILKALGLEAVKTYSVAYRKQKR